MAVPEKREARLAAKRASKRKRAEAEEWAKALEESDCDDMPLEEWFTLRVWLEYRDMVD